MSKIRHYIDTLFKEWYNYTMVKTSYRRATDRTRRKIREAFADLLAKHGSVKNITVTDLAERAEITRGTFYNYYDNLYEVGAELQAELERELFADSYEFNSVDDIEQYVNQVFAFLKQQEDVYRQLLSSDAPSAFLSQLETSMTRRVLMILHKKGIHDKNAEFELLILTNGAFAIIRKYYRNEIAVKLKDIRNYLNQKLRDMFVRYVK